MHENMTAISQERINTQNPRNDRDLEVKTLQEKNFQEMTRKNKKFRSDEAKRKRNPLADSDSDSYPSLSLYSKLQTSYNEQDNANVLIRFMKVLNMEGAIEKRDDADADMEIAPDNSVLSRLEKVKSAQENILMPNSSQSSEVKKELNPNRQNKTENVPGSDEKMIRLVPSPEVASILQELKEDTAARGKVRATWHVATQAFFLELAVRRLNENPHACDGRDEKPTRQAKRLFAENNILDLKDFYRKHDFVIEELEDRMELVELQEFQQLVIQDLADRAEAIQVFRGRLELVLRELMQKFVIDELIEEGLIVHEVSAANVLDEEVLDWVSVNDPVYSKLEESHDGSDEWVIFDF